MDGDGRYYYYYYFVFLTSIGVCFKSGRKQEVDRIRIQSNEEDRKGISGIVSCTQLLNTQRRYFKV